jgi:hypothetical protein
MAKESWVFVSSRVNTPAPLAVALVGGTSASGVRRAVKCVSEKTGERIVNDNQDARTGADNSFMAHPSLEKMGNRT